MNPLRISALALLTTALVAPAAQALDLGNGFSLTGQVELEFSYADLSTDDSLLATDLTLGWRNQADSGLGLGFDLTVDSLYFRTSSEHLDVYWGGLVLTTGIGEVTLGAARPVYDKVYRFPDLGTNTELNAGLDFFTGSVTSFYTRLSDTVATGVSITGSAGDFTYGASLHHVDPSTAAPLESSQIAVSYALGQVTVFGFFEHGSVNNGANTVSTVKGAVLYDAGRLALGAELARPENAGQTGTWVRLHAGYEVTDAITVTGDVGRMDGDLFTGTVWSLGAEYRFGKGGFVQAGAADDGNVTTFDAGLGFRF